MLQRTGPFLAVVMIVVGATPALGQNPVMMPTGMVPNTGPLSTRRAASVDPVIYITDSYVGLIDAAAPRNVMAVRFDGGYNNRQPTRAEFISPKLKLLGGAGLPLIETKIDAFDATTYGEYALTPWFSTFVEAPYRWLNPEINANESGAGDMKWGFKLCTWTSERFIATILTCVHQPTARVSALGTDHWSVEPGLLGAFRFNDKILIEGEVRYWIPINGSDFAGDVLRYGLGASYGRRIPYGGWFAPVIEGIGWTVMSGKSVVATSPDDWIIQDMNGQTIVNAYLGIRWGYGYHMDMYAGYGRALTGAAWQRDFFRLEMRYAF